VLAQAVSKTPQPQSQTVSVWNAAKQVHTPPLLAVLTAVRPGMQKLTEPVA
jgi:hypothetical protein